MFLMLSFLAPSRTVSALRIPALIHRPTVPILTNSRSCFLSHTESKLVNNNNNNRRSISSKLHQKTEDDTENTNGASNNDDTKEAPYEEYRNKNNIRDQILAAISSNGEIKVTAATTRNLVNDVMMRQSLTAVPADALGRSMTCSLLLSNGMQEDQTFQLTMACDGPIRQVVAVADTTGAVRGYVGCPSLGTMTLPEAIGKGTVQIVKNHPSWPNPYNGITSIINGDIDRDVGIYLAQSEQRACALAAGTAVAPGGILCLSAGGYVVEQLPGCSEETVRIVERNLGRLVDRDGTKGAAPTGILKNGGTPLDICEAVLDGLGMEPLLQVEPKFVCECTEDRLFRAIRLLPREEIMDIVKTQEQIEARCEFCGKVYKMGPEEVADRYKKAKGDASLDEDFVEDDE